MRCTTETALRRGSESWESRDIVAGTCDYFCRARMNEPSHIINKATSWDGQFATALLLNHDRRQDQHGQTLQGPTADGVGDHSRAA